VSSFEFEWSADNFEELIWWAKAKQKLQDQAEAKVVLLRPCQDPDINTQYQSQTNESIQNDEAALSRQYYFCLEAG